MLKSIVYGCTFILFFCVASLRAANHTFTLNVNGRDTQYKYFDEWAGWQRAKQRCEDAGARLLEPESRAETEELANKMVYFSRPNEFIWTGITDQSRSGAYRNLDGHLLSALPVGWGRNEPNLNLTSGCVVLLNSALYMKNCGFSRLYVCKVRDDTTSNTYRNDPMTCNKTFTLQINSQNFEYVFHYKYLTWHQARDRCTAAGAQLLVPEDEAEARAVREQVNPVYSYSIWTSINDLNRTGDYRTLDGRHKSSVYNKWEGGRPLSWEGALRCAVLGSDSTLHLTLCESIFPYVCKFTATAQ